MEGLIRDGVGDLAGFASGHLSSALAAGDAHFFEDIPSSPAKIRELLESNQEPEKLKGMKWLLAMLSKGNTVAEFFPDVVKNVVVKSIEVKKMVYIYLVHYADFNDMCREIALLSINSFQKDLAGTNQLIRGLALRVMTSIRVADIIQLQLLAVRKCAVDGSPYVRRCAAVALAKIHVLDPSQDEDLIEILEKLMGDSSTMVLGSAVAALVEIDPTRFDVMHACFRKLCHLLADLDEWTQVAVLGMMKRYVRNQFTDPHRGRRRPAAVGEPAAAAAPALRPAPAPTAHRGFYSDDSDSDGGHGQTRNNNSSWAPSAPTTSKSNPALPEQGSVFIGKEVSIDYDDSLDADHRLILSSSLALLKSRNSAVVLAACALHFYCGIIEPNSATTVRIAKAMVRILRSRREIQFAVLTSVKSMVIEAPWMFSDFVQDFYIKSDDPLFNRVLKLDIMAALCTRDNSEMLCRELQAYVKESNNFFVVASVQTVAKVAERNTDLLPTVLGGLMTLLTCHRSGDVHTACAAALQHLLQIGFSISSSSSEATAGSSMDFFEEKEEKKRSKKQKKHKLKEKEEEDPKFRILRDQCERVLKQALRLLFVPDNTISAPEARANLIWLAGEYYSAFQLIAKDMLRLLAVDFKDEEPCTKKEILTLGVKYSMHCPGDTEMEDLMTYVLEMSRYDMSTDVRDLARLMTAVCGLASGDDAAGDILSGDGGGGVNADALEDLSQRASRIMLATKKPPKVVLNSANSASAAAMWNGDDSVSKMLFLIDSISALTGYTVPGYSILSPWSEKQPDSSVRDKVVGSSIDAMDKGYTTNSLEDRSWARTEPSRRVDDSNFYDDDNESDDAKKIVNKNRSRAWRDSSSSSDSSNGSESDSSSESDSNSASSGGDPIRQNRNKQIMDRRSSSSNYSSSDESSSASSEEEIVPRRRERKTRTASAKPLEAVAADMTALSGGDVSRRAGVRRVVHTAPISESSVHVGGGASNAAGYLKSTGSVNLLDDLLSDYHAPAVGTNAHEAGMSSSFDFSSLGGENHRNENSDCVHSMAPAVPMTADISNDSNILAQILDSFPEVQVGKSHANDAKFLEASPVAGGEAKVYHGEEVHSVPKLLLNPDLSSGLSIVLVFRHGVKPTAVQGTGAKVGFVIYKNCGQEYAVRRIKLGFPHGVRCSTVEDVAILAPNESVTLPIEIILSAGSTIKFDVRCDRGTYKGSLVSDPWDAITPVGMSFDSFMEYKSRLRGFSESESKGCRVMSRTSTSQELLSTAVSRVRPLVDVYSLPDTGGDDGIALLVGTCSLKSSRNGPFSEYNVLITLTVERASPGCISIVVNCEDTVMNSSLSSFLKKSIMNI